jgi:protein TIF31
MVDISCKNDDEDVRADTAVVAESMLVEAEDDEKALTKVDVDDVDDDVVNQQDLVFKNLVILPPLQQKKQKKEGRRNNEMDDVIPLPPIRSEEPVQSIRAALSEIRGYSHLTNYRFVLENGKESNTLTKTSSSSTILSLPTGASPYTGLDAIISTRVVVKSFLQDGLELNDDSANNKTTSDDKEVKIEVEELVLDEFGDLSALVVHADGEENNGLKDGSGFRIVLERYDIALIRDHIVRLRSLLDGNAPNSITLDESGGGSASDGSDDTESTPSSEKETKSEDADDEKKSPVENKEGGTEAEKSVVAKQKQEKETIKAPPKDMPVFPAGKSLSPDIYDLKKFFYYACGEDPTLYLNDSSDTCTSSTKEKSTTTKTKKKNGKKRNSNTNANTNNSLTEGGYPDDISTEQLMKQIIPRLNEIEEKTRVVCNICYSGFHPPPQYRQFIGDLAYLEVTLPDGKLVSISATSLGFYVNRSTLTKGDCKFNPFPAAKACFSHELLDCLLLHSKSFCDSWNEALEASEIRNELMAKINEDGPFHSFFRVAIRGDFPGYKKASVAAASEGIDALIQIPSWLVPVPRVQSEADNSWNRNCEHVYSPAKAEDDISNSFGVDVRGGSLRDWNEELQVAREMPMGSLLERIERARYVHCCLYICTGFFSLSLSFLA